MKNRSMLTLALANVLMAKAKPDAGAESAAPVEQPVEQSMLSQALSGSVDGDAPAESPAEARKRAPASNFLPIVRGRLPLLFVHAIRFDKVLNAMSNKDLAVKFATSVGKVFDIKKGRNFAYVDASFKPSAEDVSAAESWIAQIGSENAKGIGAQGDKNLLQTTLDTYKSAGLASPEEAAAFSAARASTRVAVAPKAASTGGSAPAAEGVQASTTAQTADDLLS